MKHMEKWVFRIALAAILAPMIYITLLPEFDFEVWVPVQWLAAIHVPEILVDFIRDEADKIAHCVGAFILLLLYSKTVNTSAIRSSTFCLLALLAIAVSAEIAQFQIGRDFSFGDIVAGMFGGTLAIMTLKLTRGKKLGWAVAK